MATALHEGLHAVAFKAAALVAKQMLEAEVEQLAGPKGKHNKQRLVSRHSSQGGYIIVAGQKVKIQRPRVRGKDGHDVRLQNYKKFHDETVLDELAFERMLHGVATRHYGEVGEALPSDMEGYGSSKSSVSERFARATGALLERFLKRPLGMELLAVFADAIFLGEHALLVALGVDQDGRKHVLGMREGVTENSAICTAMFEDLLERGLNAENGLLFVVDGGKAIAKSVRDVFGDRALVQRCLVHKRRNILDHLPEREQGWVKQKLDLAWSLKSATEARTALQLLAKELEFSHPGAAASLQEGLEDTLTLQKLGITGLLRRSLRTTNTIEALNSQMRAVVRRVSRYSSGNQALRWAATAALKAEARLYRIAGHKELPLLADALKTYVDRCSDVKDRAS